MYSRYARKVGWTCELLDSRPDGDGLRFATLAIRGRGAGVLHNEAGAHSIQHITRSRRKDRIHTSNASVVVFDAHELTQRGDILLRSGDVRIDTFRGRGKGGQHRNVTDSAVRAVHVPSGVTATVTSGRSQIENRERALTVLLARVQARVRADQARHVATRRSRQGRAGRAETTRVYDLVRDMVRCSRTDQKVRGARKVLDGDMGLLLK